MQSKRLYLLYETIKNRQMVMNKQEFRKTILSLLQDGNAARWALVKQVQKFNALIEEAAKEEVKADVPQTIAHTEGEPTLFSSGADRWISAAHFAHMLGYKTPYISGSTLEAWGVDYRKENNRLVIDRASAERYIATRKR